MALSTTKEVDRCCADRAPRFRPVVRVGLVLVEPGVGFAAASLLSSRPCDSGSRWRANVKEKRRGRGAGNTVPRPLMFARHRLRSRVSGGNPGDWWMRSVGFHRDEPPRGERECGGRLRPSPDWGLKVLGVGG